jgi:hypothetical protein
MQTNSGILASILDVYKTNHKQLELLQSEMERKRRFIELCQAEYDSYDQLTSSNINNILEWYLFNAMGELSGVVEFLQRKVHNPFDVIVAEREVRDAFDEFYGTRTSAIIEQFEMNSGLSAADMMSMARYLPAPVNSMRQALSVLTKYNINYHDFAFIDIGSGMGRNLLIASEFPFAKIRGVEIAPFLHEVALSNLKIFKSTDQKCFDLRVECTNALNYEFPDMNMVIWCWEPFAPEVSTPFFYKLLDHVFFHKLHVIMIFIGKSFPAITESQHFSQIDFIKTGDIYFADQEIKNFFLTVYSNK